MEHIQEIRGDYTFYWNPLFDPVIIYKDGEVFDKISCPKFIEMGRTEKEIQRRFNSFINTYVLMLSIFPEYLTWKDFNGSRFIDEKKDYGVHKHRNGKFFIVNSGIGIPFKISYEYNSLIEIIYKYHCGILQWQIELRKGELQ